MPPKPTPLIVPPETPLTTASGSSGIGGIQSQLEDLSHNANNTTIVQPTAGSTFERESIPEESEGEYELVKAPLTPLPLNHPPHKSVTEEIPLPLPWGAPSIIDPVKVISNHQLCSPNSGEQVYPCGVC